MIPPVPKESLPQWVQEAMETRPHHFEVGDRVFGVLYAEENCVVLAVDYKKAWVKVGRDWDEEKQRYRGVSSAWDMWYVKYPEEAP